MSCPGLSVFSLSGVKDCIWDLHYCTNSKPSSPVTATCLILLPSWHRHSLQIGNERKRGIRRKSSHVRGDGSTLLTWRFSPVGKLGPSSFSSLSLACRIWSNSLFCKLSNYMVGWIWQYCFYRYLLFPLPNHSPWLQVYFPHIPSHPGQTPKQGTSKTVKRVT